MTFFEGVRHGVGFGELDGQGGVGAVVAQLGPAGDPDAVARGRPRRGVRRGRRSPGRRRSCARRASRPASSGASTDCSRMAVVSARPMPSAESTPAMRRDEDGADAERVGDRAGVLAAGAAEGGQRVAGDVVALLHGDPLDGVGDVGHGDLQESLGDLLGRCARRRSPSRISRGERGEAVAGRASASSGWSPSGPNTAGKWAGWMRPSMTLASVTVSGPPRR